MSIVRQRGAGLIEALIAILVLSIGLLGMVGMQTASVKYEQTGWVRSAIASNISSLSDRIRANANAPADAYAFSDTYALERNAIDTIPAHLTPSLDCNSTVCSDGDLATYDLTVWRRDLNQQLPGAVGFVTPTGTKSVNLRFLITVAWFNKDNVNGTNLQTPIACTAAITGIAARNCCPAAVGAEADLAGVQCVNVEVIP
jgi:type IV pilus assembly protein PilV